MANGLDVLMGGQGSPQTGLDVLMAGNAAPVQNTPVAATPTTNPVGEFFSALGHHAMNLPHGGAQLIEHGLASSAAALTGDNAVTRYLNKTVAADDAAMGQRERSYQANTPDSAASYTGAALGEIAPFLVSGGASDLLKTGGDAVTNSVTNAGARIFPQSVANVAGKVAGGAAQGAAVGAVAPVTSGNYASSKADQIGTSAALGGAIPLVSGIVGGIYNAGKNALAPIINPGGAVGNAAKNWAGDKSSEYINALRNPTQFVPGSNPTTAQILADPSIVQAEKTIAGNPTFKPQFTDLENSNNLARIQQLNDVAGQPGQLDALTAARSAAVKPLYDAAKSQTVTSDPLLDALLQRPTISQGVTQAAKIAQDEGRNFTLTPSVKAATEYLDSAGNVVPNVPPVPKAAPMRNLLSEIINDGGVASSERPDMGIDAAQKTRPGLFRKEGGKGADSLVEWMQQHGWLSQHNIDNAEQFNVGGSHDMARNMVSDAVNGNPVFHPSEDGLANDYAQSVADWGNRYGNLTQRTIPAAPATYSGQTLHDLKLGIDKAIQDDSGSFGNRVMNSQMDAKSAYMDWLDKNLPGYSEANSTYADLSKPINSMEAGTSIINKLSGGALNSSGVPQLTLPGYRSALAQALKNSEYGIQPEKQSALQAIQDDLQRSTISNSIKSPGSDTAFNLQAPNWLGRQLYGADFSGPTGLGKLISGAAGAHFGGPAGFAGGYLGAGKLGGIASDRMNKALADALLNPSKFADLLESANNPGAAQKLLMNPMIRALLDKSPQMTAYPVARQIGNAP